MAIICFNRILVHLVAKLLLILYYFADVPYNKKIRNLTVLLNLNQLEFKVKEAALALGLAIYFGIGGPQTFITI